MKKNTPISSVLTTNCTIVEAAADIHTVRKIFDFFPNQFLPVVEGLQFIGVILRNEFLREFMTDEGHNLSASDLISKEMVKLDLHNSLSDAKEVFDTNVYDVIPVTDSDGDLVGVLLREDVELHFSQLNTKPSSRFRDGLRKIMAFLSL